MPKTDIFYIGSDDYYKGDLKLCENDCFRLNKINSLDEINDKKGFLLLLTFDLIYEAFPDISDYYELDVYEIDRNIRKLFCNFEYVIIISIEEFDYGHIPFSNIYVEFANKYFNTEKGINILVNKIYQEYINKKELKISRIKSSNIKKLKSYIDKYPEEFITTKEIMNKLKVNEKWLQRYMKDMNYLYNNIGYNKKKRLWYVVK